MEVKVAMPRFSIKESEAFSLSSEAIGWPARQRVRSRAGQGCRLRSVAEGNPPKPKKHIWMLFRRESLAKVAYIWKQKGMYSKLLFIYAGLLLAVGGWRHSRGYALQIPRPQ